MKHFELPGDLKYNNGFIENPGTYLEDSGCVSWLCLIGEEFSKMENGMSYQQVQEATPYSANVVSDPPEILNLDHAQQHSGLKLGADPDEVIATAEKDNAPFTKIEEYKNWVRSSIEALRKASEEK